MRSLFAAVLLFFFVSSPASEVTFNLSSECIELLRTQKDPLECCTYPRLEASDHLIQQCLRDCERDEKVKYNCCYRSCLFAKSGIFINGSFCSEKISSFFNPLDDEGRKVVENSLRKCESEIPHSPMTTEDSCIPNSIHDIITCIFKENFLNCPHYNNDESCASVKHLTAACGKSDGKFIFHNFFFKNQKSGTAFQ